MQHESILKSRLTPAHIALAKGWINGLDLASMATRYLPALGNDDGQIDLRVAKSSLIAVLADLKRTGRKPARDLCVAFFADEEAGGRYGAHWSVDHHPEWFEGATEAISEVGGFSVDIDGRRTYLLQTAEKGIAWLRLNAHGRAGHGSVPNPDNAIVHLAGAIERIAAHKWPREYIASVRELLDRLSELTGIGWSDEDLAKLAGDNISRAGTQAQAEADRLRDKPPSLATIEALDGTR